MKLKNGCWIGQSEQKTSSDGRSQMIFVVFCRTELRGRRQGWRWWRGVRTEGPDCGQHQGEVPPAAVQLISLKSFNPFEKVEEGVFPDNLGIVVKTKQTKRRQEKKTLHDSVLSVSLSVCLNRRLQVEERLRLRTWRSRVRGWWRSNSWWSRRGRWRENWASWRCSWRRPASPPCHRWGETFTSWD